nr:family 43 glycosylhydrolase [Actinopolymorpha alba]
MVCDRGKARIGRESHGRHPRQRRRQRHPGFVSPGSRVRSRLTSRRAPRRDLRALHDLYYQPDGCWFGDCMPLCKDGVFYLFHQRDTRKPGPFGEPFGWALARTTDFVSYDDLGEVLERGGDDDQDQFIFAGSVFEADRTFYAMYTGYNRDFKARGKASQVLMVATSPDLTTWTKTGQELVVPQPGYDPDDWRDPFVLWDDDTQRYVMILGARKVDGEKILTGRTVSFSSTDLRAWTFEGDFWAPGLYSMHEMPDLFRMGDYWYLLTTEYSDKSKTVYRMSRSLDGPWVAPADDAFDGRAYYAARSAAHGDQRYLFGWVPTKEDCDERRSWQWGGTLVVHEIMQRDDGSLGVVPPAGVVAAFSDPVTLPHALMTLQTSDSLAECVLAEESGEVFAFETTVRFTAGTRAFSLRLYEDKATGDGYEYRFSIPENRVSFDRRPNYPWYRYDNKGLERPITLTPERDYTITVIVDNSIATLYVDGVALNARAYDRPGRTIALDVIDGALEISRAEIRKGLRQTS